MPANERTFRPTEAGAVPRSGSLGPIRWFKGLSITGRSMGLGGLLLILICMLFAEENWRGRRAWEICRKDLDAKRVFHWLQFLPARAPDDLHFARTPLLGPLFGFNPKPRGPGQPP